MTTKYKIHPGIGIARLGNSPDELYLSPEKPASLPTACDAMGNPLLGPNGEEELPEEVFKDAQGRIKRQAARFQIYVYDDESPEGRPLKIGDPISGGGNQGTLVDIQWRVYLANKKASWYAFEQLEGEHGYAPDHPRRNASITDSNARQRLIIDPGPRTVDATENRCARFDRDGAQTYAPTFPPELQPCSIDTLGELKTDDDARLLVLGGHGNSGSYLYDDFGQPRIDEYANNDGWFDDTSDGPVMARLVMFSEDVQQQRFIDVEYPAWVIVGYPSYAPQILDMISMDEVIYDTAVRNFAIRTDVYGKVGSFKDPQHIPPQDTEALVHWKASRLGWNPDYRPWFYRDIWPILFRADEFTYLTSVLGMSNYPHNQSARGNFNPYKLGVPPTLDREAYTKCEQECLDKLHSGEAFVENLEPVLAVLSKQAFGSQGGATEDSSNRRMAAAADSSPGVSGLITEELAGGLNEAVAEYVHRVHGKDLEAMAASRASAVHGDSAEESAQQSDAREPGASFNTQMRQWKETAETNPAAPQAKEKLYDQVNSLLADLEPRAEEPAAWQLLKTATLDHLRDFTTGRMLRKCRERCLEKATHDPFRDDRLYLFDLLRRQGEENHLRVGSKPTSRIYGLPLMPLLAGDNPISNTLPSKFLRLTDFQYYLLRQWAYGMFYNEQIEGWGAVDPWQPYKSWKNLTGRDLDQGVLTNVLGGAFCPGGEAGWILRNPAIYLEPYRIKADPDFSTFRQTAAQANAWRGAVPDREYSSYVSVDLSQDDDFDRGMQPGDITKHMALPWQADYNECTSQPINITYTEWNDIYPDSEGNSLMKREEQSWETLWWPAHRPLQTWVVTAVNDGQPTYQWLDWSPGVPQTLAGDLKMVTEWKKLGFVRRNPFLPPGDVKPTELPPDQKYVVLARGVDVPLPSKGDASTPDHSQKHSHDDEDDH